MYKIPELNDMKQYWTDEIDEVIASFLILVG